jgi:hypothetical protein
MHQLSAMKKHTEARTSRTTDATTDATTGKTDVREVQIPAKKPV